MEVAVYPGERQHQTLAVAADTALAEGDQMWTIAMGVSLRTLFSEADTRPKQR